MTIYRFRITFEDYDSSREIDIRSVQTFEDLHNAIHASLNYSPEVSSSFYISNDQWIKGTEITIFPDENKTAKEIALMSNSRLNNFIEDPHQKFYYISNFNRPFDFHVELIRIINQVESPDTFPKMVKSSGEAPKQFVQLVKPMERSSSVLKGKKTKAIIPHQELLPAEEEEEEPENDFALNTSEEIEVEDHKDLAYKITDEEGGERDELIEDSELNEEDFDEFGIEGPEEGGHSKDEY
jgi:hypothetical protein